MEEGLLQSYYNKRAEIYEKIYEKPERQDDLRELTVWLQSELKGRRVLEVACGTGYWTERLQDVALSIYATDQSSETLALAREKALDRVVFAQDDAFSLDSAKGPFDAAFAGFWWSHIPKSQIHTFLLNLHNKLEKGARVVFIDNIYVEGSNHPITRTDSDGNTYQCRQLPDGSSHEILKNFPHYIEFYDIFGSFGIKPEILRLRYYWGISYVKS